MRFRVARQVGYLTAATTMVRMSTALLTVLFARVYGPVQYGAYATALGLANLVILLPDFGVFSLITRDGARDRELLPQLMRGGLLIKGALSLLAFAALLIISAVLHYPPLTLELVVVCGVTALLTDFYRTYYGGYLARERNASAGALAAAVGVLSLVGAAVAVAMGAPILWSAAWSGVGGITAAIIAGLAWRRALAVHVPYSLLRTILRRSLPFAIAGMLYYIYFRIDVVMLSAYRPPADVGWYNAAYRLVAVLYFIPGSVCAALFARLSVLAHVDRRSHSRYVAQMVRFMTSFALPVTGTIVAGAPVVIGALFGRNFASSAPLLQILGWFLLFQCLSFPLGDGLSTTNRQTVRVWIMGAAAIANIGLNLVLIPSEGGRGAAVATLVTEGFVALSYWVALFAARPDRDLVVCLIPAVLGGGLLLVARAALSSRFLNPWLALFLLGGCGLLIAAATFRLTGKMGLSLESFEVNPTSSPAAPGALAPDP